MKAYQAGLAHVDDGQTQVLGISISAPASNKRFAEKLGLDFPLLSDTSRKVSKSYGVLHPLFRLAKRAVFVIDKEGVIRAVETGSASLNPAKSYDACARLS